MGAMAVHFRHAEPRDVGRCLELVRTHGRGYHDRRSSERLPALWERLIASRLHAVHVLVDDAERGERAIRGMLSGVFLTDRAAAELETAPRPFFARRIVEDPSALADYEEVARAQLDQGANAFGLDFVLEGADWTSPDTLRFMPAMVAAAHDWVDGVRLRSFYREIFGDDLVAVGRAAGMPVRSWSGEDAARVGRLPPTVRPTLTGMTEVEARQYPASTGWLYFQASEPKFRFTRAQRDLLLLALRGLRDDAISVALDVSPHTVQKRWRSVFEHVDDVRPDLAPPRGEGSGRGAERRTELLAYLRAHRSELRPHPRRSSERRRRP